MALLFVEMCTGGSLVCDWVNQQEPWPFITQALVFYNGGHVQMMLHPHLLNKNDNFIFMTKRN